MVLLPQLQPVGLYQGETSFSFFLSKCCSTSLQRSATPAPATATPAPATATQPTPQSSTPHAPLLLATPPTPPQSSPSTSQPIRPAGPPPRKSTLDIGTPTNVVKSTVILNEVTGKLETVTAPAPASHSSSPVCVCCCCFCKAVLLLFVSIPLVTNFSVLHHKIFYQKHKAGRSSHKPHPHSLSSHLKVL